MNFYSHAEFAEFAEIDGLISLVSRKNWDG